MQKQVKDVLAFIKKFFNFSDKSGDLTEKQKENLKKDVIDVHTQVQQLEQYLPALKNVSIYIVIAVLLYWFGSFLGWVINLIVFGVLAYGVYSSFLVNGTTSV